MSENSLTIAMISDDFIPALTGVGIHVQKMSREMVARGHRVIVITTRRQGQPSSEIWEGVRVDRVFSLPIFKFYQALPSRRHLRKIFIENSVEVVHCHYLGLMMLQAVSVAKTMGIPGVLTAHMTADHLTQPALMRPLKDVISRLIARIYEKFTHVICVSATYAKQVERFSVFSFVHYISNPIDFDGTEYSSSPSADQFAVLYAGRLNPEKNVGLLIKAFQLLNKNRPHTKLLIAGQGDQLKNLRQLTESLGIADHVQFLGHVPHEKLPQLYAQAEVFVLPSLVETQGMVALEAMRFRRPVIVTDRIVSAKELVEEGKNGFIVDADDPQVLAQRLIQLYDSPALRQEQGAAGFEKSSGYTVESIADELDQVYQTVCSERIHRPDILDHNPESKRSVCPHCHVGSFERRSEHVVIPSNAKRFKEEYFTVWRCAFCRSIHSFAKFPLEEYYLHSPFEKRKLNVFNRVAFEKLYRWLKRHGISEDKRILFYGISHRLFQDFFNEKGYRHFDVLDKVITEDAQFKQNTQKYDAVIVFDVLERAENASLVIEFVKQQLVDGGLLFVHTPDADKIKLPLASEHAMHQPYRLHISSWLSLETLLKKQGFSLLFLEHRNYLDTFVPFINYKTFHDLPNFHDGTLESAFIFRPAEIFKKIWRIPRFLVLGFFGGIFRDRSNLMVVFKNSAEIGLQSNSRQHSI